MFFRFVRSLAIIPIVFLENYINGSCNETRCYTDEMDIIDEFGDPNKYIICLNNKFCQCSCCKFYKYCKKMCILKPWLVTLPYQVEKRFVTPAIQQFYYLQTVPDYTIIDEVNSIGSISKKDQKKMEKKAKKKYKEKKEKDKEKKKKDKKEKKKDKKGRDKEKKKNDKMEKKKDKKGKDKEKKKNDEKEKLKDEDKEKKVRENKEISKEREKTGNHDSVQIENRIDKKNKKMFDKVKRDSVDTGSEKECDRYTGGENRSLEKHDKNKHPKHQETDTSHQSTRHEMKDGGEIQTKIREDVSSPMENPQKILWHY